jgi:RNA-binding protein
LQEAGTVLHLARSGRLILKAAPEIVREGSILVDEQGRRTAKVLEIIGPVSSPYLSAQPFTDRIERIVGAKLYLGEAQEPVRSRGEFRRDDRGSTGPGQRFRPRPSGPRQNRGSASVHHKRNYNQAERKKGTNRRG